MDYTNQMIDRAVMSADFLGEPAAKLYREALIKIKNLQEVFCSNDDNYPASEIDYEGNGTMIIFQQDGETHLGGYDPEKKHFFDLDQCIYEVQYGPIYWRYLDDLEFQYKKQNVKKI